MTINSSRYVHGYGTASQTMAVRTAENFAGFFTPHLKQGMTVLDMGCGPGTISVGLAELVAPGVFHGVDIGASEVAKATERAEELGLSNARFQTADATNLPFDDEIFDAAFSSAMLEHVPEPSLVIDEMKRVLNPGGMVALIGGSPSRIVPVPDKPFVHRALEVYVTVWKHRGGHPEMGTEQIELLTQAEFTDITVTGTFEARQATADYAERMTADLFVKEAEKLGVSTSEELEEIAERIREFAGMGGRWLVPWIEVIAKRPR